MSKIQTPIPATADLRRRTVRSYVRREGRMTGAQRRALEELWPRYGLDGTDSVLDFETVFDRKAAVALEIGFGNGAALAEMAVAHPQRNYLGVEVHRPGVGRLLLELARRDIDNVRLLCHDAEDVLARGIAPATLDRVLIFFPDPWPKKRHHKRRLLQPAFAALVASRLIRGGRLHLATDWEDYAMQIMEVLSGTAGLRNVAGPGQFSERPDYRPLTRYEQRGRDRGHDVWDIVFERL